VPFIALISFCFCIIVGQAPLLAQGVTTGPVEQPPITLLGSLRTDSSATLRVYAPQPGLGHITVETRCAGNTQPSSLAGVRATLLPPQPWPTMASILILDASIESGTLPAEVALALQTETLAQPDIFLGVWLSNQDITVLTSPIAPFEMPSTKVERGFGVRSILTHIANACSELRTYTNEHKAIVVVVTGSDEASVGTTIQQCVDQCLLAGVTVYPIVVGESTARYPWRVLASETGGKITVVSAKASAAETLVAKASMLLQAHAASTQHIVAQRHAPCDSYTIVVSDSLLGADSIQNVHRLYPPAMEHAIVALFDDSTDSGVQAYYPILGALAERMIEDPSVNVVLIGHVSHGTPQPNERALERSANVRDFLVGYGVESNRIDIRSEGANRPRWFATQSGDHVTQNNRVEAQIWSNEKSPYTVIVSTATNEDAAVKQVALWGKRGFRSYFEPIVVNGLPTYRVVLWGYASKSQALAAAADIKKRFKVQAQVL
jgi:outer membrane protein OmpA-like peptidoglycan-associated protein